MLKNGKKYQINFLEIGTDKDHAHFLVQSVFTYSVTKIVTTVKSIIARGVFRECPEVKKELWGGEFWTDGYFASTVSKHGDENMISNYVKNQGRAYLLIRICVRHVKPMKLPSRALNLIEGKHVHGECMHHHHHHHHHAPSKCFLSRFACPFFIPISSTSSSALRSCTSSSVS